MSPNTIFTDFSLQKTKITELCVSGPIESFANKYQVLRLQC